MVFNIYIGLGLLWLKSLGVEHIKEVKFYRKQNCPSSNARWGDSLLLALEYEIDDVHITSVPGARYPAHPAHRHQRDLDRLEPAGGVGDGHPLSSPSAALAGPLPSLHALCCRTPPLHGHPALPHLVQDPDLTDHFSAAGHLHDLLVNCPRSLLHPQTPGSQEKAQPPP